MKVCVDPDLCVATGSCKSTCPQIFEVGEDGIAVVKMAEVPPELENECREAARLCPVEAIIVEE